MLLAGDIGGTKTLLGLYKPESGPRQPIAEAEFPSANYPGLEDGPLLIDSHSRPVADPVWSLYAEVIARTGPRPTLIEWDNDVPAFAQLLSEAQHAATLLAKAPHVRAA